jgi:hypothetical protein
MRISERAMSRLVLLDAFDDFRRAGAIAFGLRLAFVFLLFFLDQDEATIAVLAFG